MSMVAACPACSVAPLAEHTAHVPTPPDLVFSLPGIHCAGCIGTVERTLARVAGVSSARVNLSLKRVAVHGMDLSEETLVAALKGAGYDAFPLDRSLLETADDSVGRGLLVRLAVAGFAMMNVMLFSVAVWSGASDATRDLFHLISAMITLPAVLFCGQPFFAKAWSALRVGTMNMDVPISLAILLAAGMSLFEALNSGAHAYFDAALSLTFFLLVGRYLDHRSRNSARSAAKELAALEVQTAQRMTDGIAAKVAVTELAVGDRLLIATGMRVPVDGSLASANALSDRSFLTGESDPQPLVRGDTVQAGEINQGQPFEMTATAVGDDTTLRRVAALVEMAENSRNSYTNLADRAARIYAPAVHLLALAAFLVWVWISGDVRLALNIAVAVLIITCPCALGLAVPAVATAAISRLYGMGFLVKSGTALERLAEVDLAIFDKTGTLTISGSGARLSGLSDKEVAVIRALTQASDHPTSRGLRAVLPPAPPVTLTDVKEVPGFGMTGMLDGEPVKVGGGEWLDKGFKGLGLRIGSETPVALPMSDVPRPGVKAALDGLRAMGIPSRILSGDRQSAVARLAAAVGVSDIKSGVSATDKHAYLEDLKAQGLNVLMVGDGLNDTGALAAAHASVAPSTALDASRNAADVVLLRESLADFPVLIRIARATTRLSRENFAIAAGYNAIAVPVALLGYASPLLAAIAMSVSSLTVLANALRIRGVK